MAYQLSSVIRQLKLVLPPETAYGIMSSGLLGINRYLLGSERSNVYGVSAVRYSLIFDMGAILFMTVHAMVYRYLY